MSVAVSIPAFMHETANIKTAEVSGATVGECLHNLVGKYPRLGSQIFDSNGKLHSYLDIFINRKSSQPGALSKPVHDGDELYILSLILGG